MADATQVQRRRGTAAQCAAMTPAEGEIIVNMTDDRIHVGDGLVAGGIVLPNARDLVRQSFTYAVAGGTANALTLSIPQMLAYSEGSEVSFRAIANNSGNVTIDVNGLGVRNIYKNNGLGITALDAGDIVNGGIYRISYDGAQFQILGSSFGSNVRDYYLGKRNASLQPSVPNSIIIPDENIESSGSSFNTSTGIFTCPRNGVYLFSLNTTVTRPGVNGTSSLNLRMMKNGALYFQTGDINVTYPGIIRIPSSIFSSVYLNSGDTVSFSAFSNTAGSIVDTLMSITEL